MKKFILFVGLIGLWSCSSKPGEETLNWQNKPFSHVLSQSDKDVVFIDFYTDWCVWCKRLDKDTYSDPKVRDYMGDHFTATRIDAEKGEGINLAAQYHISGYPTLVFVDKNGKEVDRIVGYLPPQPFLAKIDSVAKNIGTAAALESAVADDPNNSEIWKQLAKKYDERGDLKAELKVWDTLKELKTEDPEKVDYSMTELKARIDNSPKTLEKYIHDNPNSTYIAEAYSNALYMYRRMKEPVAEGNLYLDYVNTVEQKGDGNPNLWNAFAWRMTEIDQHLQEALTRASKAVEAVSDQPAQTRAQIMDTKAEVLWKLGRAKEAIDVMDKCIALQPDDDYYQKQKTKFQG